MLHINVLVSVYSLYITFSQKKDNEMLMFSRHSIKIHNLAKLTYFCPLNYTKSYKNYSGTEGLVI